MRVYHYVGYPNILRVEALYVGIGGRFLCAKSEPIATPRQWPHPFVRRCIFNNGSGDDAHIYVGCTSNGEIAKA